MALLNSLWIKAETLKKMAEVVNKQNYKGIEITIATNDEATQYGQNVVAWVSQTKEQKEAKNPKFYVGNGEAVWTNGNPVFIPRKAKKEANTNQLDGDWGDDETPF